MKTKILMAAFLTGLVATAGAVQAQDERKRPDFATLDLDGDGALTMEEMQPRGEARFAEADSNGDSALSAEELTATINANAADRVAGMIERFDENGDGVLQQDEMSGRNGDRVARMFERVDADGNGAISEEEFESAGKRGKDRDASGQRDRG